MKDRDTITYYITVCTKDAIPKCGVSPHDVAYLFNWAANHTNLTVKDLWTKTRSGLHKNYDNDED